MQDTLGYLSFLNANPTKATIARTIHINQSTSWSRPRWELDSGGTRTGRFGFTTAIIGATVVPFKYKPSTTGNSYWRWKWTCIPCLILSSQRCLYCSKGSTTTPCDTTQTNLTLQLSSLIQPLRLHRNFGQATQLSITLSEELLHKCSRALGERSSVREGPLLAPSVAGVSVLRSTTRDGLWQAGDRVGSRS